MTMSADASQLATLLSVLSQPDTEAIRQAEVALKPLLKDPRCVPALVEILKAKDTQVSLQSFSVLLLGFLSEKKLGVVVEVLFNWQCWHA
jgi:ubiquinone biosynthesis protein UbiJ